MSCARTVRGSGAAIPFVIETRIAGDTDPVRALAYAFALQSNERLAHSRYRGPIPRR